MDQFNNRQFRETNFVDNNFHNSYDLERKLDRYTFQQIEMFLQQQVTSINLV